MPVSNQVAKIQELCKQNNNAFLHFNEAVKALNETKPNFAENCIHNIQMARHLMMLAYAIEQKSQEILQAYEEFHSKQG